jgi:hypothetical protein
LFCAQRYTALHCSATTATTLHKVYGRTRLPLACLDQKKTADGMIVQCTVRGLIYSMCRFNPSSFYPVSGFTCTPHAPEALNTPTSNSSSNCSLVPRGTTPHEKLHSRNVSMTTESSKRIRHRIRIGRAIVGHEVACTVEGVGSGGGSKGSSRARAPIAQCVSDNRSSGISGCIIRKVSPKHPSRHV